MTSDQHFITSSGVNAAIERGASTDGLRRKALQTSESKGLGYWTFRDSTSGPTD